MTLSHKIDVSRLDVPVKVLTPYGNACYYPPMSEFNANLELVAESQRSYASDDIHDRRTETELVAAVKRRYGYPESMPITFRGGSLA
jgi:hypothetical protein